MAGGLALLLLSSCARFAESEGIKPPLPAGAEEQRGVPPGQPAGEGEAAQATPPQAAPRQLTPEDRYQIFRGRGGVVGQPRRALAQAKVEPGGGVTLNFVDADIREVLKATLGEILGVNYTVPSAIQGTVTVQTSRPISRDSLLPTLETILRLNGVALVREGAVYSVQPLDSAAQGNPSIRLGMASAGADEAYSIQVVPLHYVGAAQMAESLRPIARQGGVLYVDEARNILILGGTSYELDSMLQAIEVFDVNWLAGMSFGLFKLEYADAKSVTENLNALLSDGKHGIAGGMVRLVPVDRMNAIMAVSRQQRYIEDVQQWVKRLDTPGGGGGNTRQLFIYFVQNGRATDLADVLNNVFAGRTKTAAVSAGQPLSGELAPGRQAVLLGQPTAAEAMAALQQQEEAPPPDSEDGGPAPPTTVQASATPATGTGIAISEGSRVNVVADEQRNALLISGTPSEHQAILAALKQLDRRPLEVLIEVTIADVTLTDELRYGVRWFFESGNHSVRLSDLSSGAVTSTFPALSYVFSTPSARAVLDLLSSVTDVQIISAPQLFVLNNQEAQLQVGDQVPVATQLQQEVTSSGAPLLNTVQLKDTGVILHVTPRVNEGGLVILDIQQEVSQVKETAGTGTTITPTISKRVITTTAAVQSGQTVALGGLIQNNKSNKKVGVPVLSAIPFLGALFRYTTDTITRDELLVLVTPRVIRDQRGALEITNELRQRMKDLKRMEASLVRTDDDSIRNTLDENTQPETQAQ
jgi:general secretion pathway protein D